MSRVGGVSARRIIITGAASGIAAATKAELERRGAQVVGLDLNEQPDGLIACDVCDQASVDQAVHEATARLGGVDVLINCAWRPPRARAYPPTPRRSP